MATNNSVNESQTGFQSMDSNGVHNGRTFQSGTNISITNGSGVPGNPVIDVTPPFGVTSLTANGLILGNGSSNVSALSAATNGQIPIGSTGNAPILATLTAGTNVTITNGPGSITIDASGASGGSVDTLTGDVGGAVSGPNINFSGATTTRTTGNPGTKTMAVEVVATNNAILIGRGPTTPITTVGPLTNGQLLIGRSGNSPVGATLTAGTNISITNASGSITISNNAPLGPSSANLNLFDDFLYPAPVSGMTIGFLGSFGVAGIGTGYVATNTTSPAYSTNHPGIVTLYSGAAAGSKAQLTTNQTVYAGGGELIVEFGIYIETLSSSGSRYNLRCGLNDDTVNTNRIDFSYIDNVNSGRWVLTCSNNGTSTVVNSTLAVAASQWTILRIIVNAAGTSAQFYAGTTVSGLALIGTIATNLPTTRMPVEITQSYNSGSPSGRTSLDYISIQKTLTTPR